jgi:hypothetical protein
MDQYSHAIPSMMREATTMVASLIRSRVEL